MVKQQSSLSSIGTYLAAVKSDFMSGSVKCYKICGSGLLFEHVRGIECMC